MSPVAARHPWWSLLLCVAAVALTASVGAVASANAPSFYAQLDRPAWAPPATVFGPVWTGLYALMAVSAWGITQARDTRAHAALILFGIHLLANGLWSWLFFAWRQGALATVEIGVLWLLIVMTMIAFARIRRWTAVLLVPYLLWVSYAAALTVVLWQRNPLLLG